MQGTEDGRGQRDGRYLCGVLKGCDKQLPGVGRGILDKETEHGTQTKRDMF